MHLDTSTDSLRAGDGGPLRAWLAHRVARRRKVALQEMLCSLSDHTLRDIGYSRDPVAASIARFARYPAAGP